jgi:hypothetical protein
MRARLSARGVVRALVLGAASLVPHAAGAATTERPDDVLRALLITAIEDADSFEDRFDAEVWLVDMSSRLARTVADPAERLTILRTAHQEAVRARLEPEIVLSVIQVESNLQPAARAHQPAPGLHDLALLPRPRAGSPVARAGALQRQYRSDLVPTASVQGSAQPLVPMRQQPGARGAGPRRQARGAARGLIRW